MSTSLLSASAWWASLTGTARWSTNAQKTCAPERLHSTPVTTDPAAPHDTGRTLRTRRCARIAWAAARAMRGRTAARVSLKPSARTTSSPASTEQTDARTKQPTVCSAMQSPRAWIGVPSILCRISWALRCTRMAMWAIRWAAGTLSNGRASTAAASRRRLPGAAGRAGSSCRSLTTTTVLPVRRILRWMYRWVAVCSRRA